MPEATKKQPRIFDFLAAPPAIAYLDPSFLLNVLVAGARYHAECVAYTHRLETAKTTLVLSNLGLDEVWFVLLRIQATAEHGEKGWLTLAEIPRHSPSTSATVRAVTTNPAPLSAGLLIVRIQARTQASTSRSSALSGRRRSCSQATESLTAAASASSLTSTP